MSQLCDKRDYDIPTRHLPTLRFSVTLLWVENVSSLLKERNETVNRLCAMNHCHIFRYTNVSKCLKYLKSVKSYERIVIVMTIDNCSINTSDISRLVKYQQIQSVFLVDGKDHDVSIYLSVYNRDGINKIGGLFHNYEPLFSRLQELLKEAKDIDDDFFSFFNRPEKALQDLRHELGRYICSQLLKVVLKSMAYSSSEAKKEMIAECRACCYNNPHDLAMIDEFERTYRSADAILWYTKPCFLYRLINRTLRTDDSVVLYKFRYFIVDLCLNLEETALTSVDHTELFRVYRGSKLSRNEVEKLRVGSLVATNGFFSSSRYLDVAQHFVGIDVDTGMSPSQGRNDRYQYIIFEVDIDLNNSPDVVVKDVSKQSAIPDENEMLFTLSTTFIIHKIDYDDVHLVWYIRMTTSSEVAELNREYTAYILARCAETTPLLLFGHLVCDYFSAYSPVLNYLHRLLRSKTLDDSDRPNIYYYIARAYRSMGKNDQAIEYCRCAHLLVRRRSTEFSMTYIRTLALLGTIYSELGELERSMYYYKRATAFCRRTVPQNHCEFGFHSNRLAYVYWQRKQYQSAFDLVTDTLSFIEKGLSIYNPGQAQALHIMGLVQHSLNNPELALHYFEQSLKMRESLEATDHPHVARTCYELSKLHEEQENYSVALDYAQRSLCIRNAKLPRSHKELKQSIELVEHLSMRNNTKLVTPLRLI